MYLFVYGTLKRGHGNHRVLGDSEYIGEFKVPGFKMFSLGGFPGVVKGEGSIIGELYRVPDNRWPHLDGLEGYDADTHTGMYLREPLTILSEVGTWDAFIYVWNRRVPDKFIEDGIWRS